MVSFSSTLFRTVAWFELVPELFLFNYIRSSLNRTGSEAKAQQKVREEARRESKACLKLQLGARRLALTLPLCAFCIINTTDSFISLICWRGRVERVIILPVRSLLNQGFISRRRRRQLYGNVIRCGFLLTRARLATILQMKVLLHVATAFRNLKSFSLQIQSDQTKALIGAPVGIGERFTGTHIQKVFMSIGLCKLCTGCVLQLLRLCEPLEYLRSLLQMKGLQL